MSPIATVICLSLGWNACNFFMFVQTVETDENKAGEYIFSIVDNLFFAATCIFALWLNQPT